MIAIASRQPSVIPTAIGRVAGSPIAPRKSLKQLPNDAPSRADINGLVVLLNQRAIITSISNPT